MDGLEGDAPTEFGAEDAFIAGVETPACIVSSLWDLRLDYGVVTLLRSSKRKMRL